MEVANIIDWEKCLQISNDSPELAQDLLMMFTKELPGIIQSVTQALNENNLEAAYEIIHKFHGGCCYCGVPTLKKLAFELEQTLKVKNKPASETLWSELNQEISLVIEAVEKKTYLDP